MIDPSDFWDDTLMFPRWSVVICGLACGCAAQVDDTPNVSEPSDSPATGGTLSGAGAAAGGASGAAAGSASSAAGSANKGGSGGSVASAGTAGSSHAGRGGSSMGGGAGSNAGGVAGHAAGGSAGSGGSATKPADTNLPYSEDFEDGEANGFIPWNDAATAGPWAVVADGGGKIYQPQAPVSDLEFAVGGSTAWTDVSMTVKVRLQDGSSGAQVVLRFKEPKTYLFVEMAVGKYKLRARANGSTQDLISPSPKPTIAPGTWYTVGISAKGTSVTLTLDGMPIGAPVTCNAAISNGGIALGVAQGSVSFDDVTVDVAP